jgi:hypothetical protein
MDAAEIRLIEQLRARPEILARVQSIVELTNAAEGPLKTADEVETILIQEIRLLGNSTMSEWAKQAENRVSNELKEQDGSVRSRKKKAHVVVCLWGGDGVRAYLAQPD